MAINTKHIILVPLFGLTMNACKPVFYANTFVSTHDKKVLVKDDTNEERLVDCTKGAQNAKQLISDLPYFKEGDPIKLQTVQRYEGFRVFKIDETVLEYNHDTIQIRKDREIIEKYKNDTIQSQRQR
nr:hypothetical protein [Candidatus Enterousia merdequi]